MITNSKVILEHDDLAALYTLPDNGDFAVVFVVPYRNKHNWVPVSAASNNSRYPQWGRRRPALNIHTGAIRPHSAVVSKRKGKIISIITFMHVHDECLYNYKH